jgi:predicted O-methyltransferase YrrM
VIVRRITLSSRLLSEALWSRLFEHAAARYLDRAEAFFATLGKLDELRSVAQYNTGSISTSAQWALFCLAYYWRPALVAEVDTFIGKSAFALALGSDAAGQHTEIHTCDMSNRFDLPTKITKCSLVQYPGSPSTQMLSEMLEDGYRAKVDLFHFDGRIQKEDLVLLSGLGTKDAIIVLDDFEGMEKGVANLFALRSAPEFKDHLCVYPPSEALLQRFGFTDHATCALVVPRSVIDFSPQ